MANPTLHLHFYLPIASTYSVDDFVTYLRGSTDPTTAEQASEPPSDRFDTAGVSLDFKNKRSLGLSPMGHDAAEIKPDALMDLLKASKAKLVILATCASSTLGLKNLKKGPAVVVTNSGSNLKTWSVDWANALTPFLLLLIDYEVGKRGQPVARNKGRATIKEALDASNEAFKGREKDDGDRFELAYGDPSTVVFPLPEKKIPEKK